MKKLLVLLAVLLAMVSVSEAQNKPTTTYLQDLAGKKSFEELSMITHSYVANLYSARISQERTIKGSVDILVPVFSVKVPTARAFQKTSRALRAELQTTVARAESFKKQVENAKNSKEIGRDMALSLKASLGELQTCHVKVFRCLDAMTKEQKRGAFTEFNGAWHTADSKLKMIDALLK
jgi:hypothetical protein